ncbi:MAG: DNA-directed RNA polymerase subunit beta [Firmicutes bacterium]|nr:DNA-directed RNA polymerase subunit beta [Bacillota bacterium]
MEISRLHPVKKGNATRMSYARVKEVLEMPDLLAIQKDSYNWFLNEGLKEVFDDISPITDYNGNLVLEFLNFRIEKENTKYNLTQCKERGATYAAPVRVKVRLRNKEFDEIKEQEIFMGDFPLMTEAGTFVINGSERVIVSQIVRSPGIYYTCEKDRHGKNLLSSQVIPSRGAWLEYETDSNDVFHVKVDRQRKIPITVLIRSLGFGSNEDIKELFGEEPKLLATMEKDSTASYEEGIIELYKRMRPGEPPTVESSEILLTNTFFDAKRYDLATVGRYKYNKKLLFANRIRGCELYADVVDPETGEIIAQEGTKLTLELCNTIQDAGVSYVEVKTDAIEGRDHTRILSNLAVDIDPYIAKFGIKKEDLNISEKVYLPALKDILAEFDDKESFMTAVKARMGELVPKHITKEDILASINYCIHLDYGIGTDDDIDHLGNRRIKAVGELLQNQFRIGLTRMERSVREKMTSQDPDTVTPQTLINIKPVTASIKEFFGSHQLSQFMDQNNPLAELTHKRRLSALGPGGLSRERAGFEVRDVHTSHYGRMCPIETPEGPNIGLINSLACYAKINKYGFIEAPYRLIDKSGDVPVVTDEVVYVSADEEENYIIAQANEPIDEKGHFINEKITCRDGKENVQVTADRVDMMDVSPRQLVSVATALIPFLQNDDVTRALMGSNMQRQAVPLLTTDSPVVGTGIETKTARDSCIVVYAKEDGTVENVDSSKIVIKNNLGISTEYELQKFKRSNQANCINQRPIVSKGDSVKAGDIIADGPSTSNGELALGKNPLIGFMTWEGYNYEDAVLLSERLVMDDVYTSIHIEEYMSEARNTKLGDEEITRDIPNVGDDALKDLDETGIIRIGAEVRPNDILVGKVTPKGETELTAEERLLRAIFGEKAREVRDTSLRVPHGAGGIVVDVQIFTRENGGELAPGVNQSVKVYIAQKRKISVGDKMAGRHGNKGVVSRVLPVEDMPYLPNGRPLDIVLNPLGVPSRMNIGQVLEMHLGLASNILGWKVATPVFEGANEEDIVETLEMANDYVNTDWDSFKEKWSGNINDDVMSYLYENRDHREEWKGVKIDHTGRVKLRDGRTGEEFDNPTTIGFMHYLKLHHLVDDKIHARSTGPYSLVTQQPLGGKAQFGGQRFGEMEVWALEAYGAAYTLQEILTVKSDDIVGRVKTYEAIVKDENIPEPGVPESFKVLLKELQALGLDVRIFDKDKNEVEITEDIDEDGELRVDVNMEGNEPPEEQKEEEKSEDDIMGVLDSIKMDDIEVDSDDDFDADEDFSEDVFSEADLMAEDEILADFEDLTKLLDGNDDFDIDNIDDEE